MEIGLGIHGEAGVRKGPLQSADEITTELMDKILNEMDGSKKVSVLVNGLGSTPLMDFILCTEKLMKY